MCRRARQAMVFAQSDVIHDIFRNTKDLPTPHHPLLRRETDPPSPGPKLIDRYNFSGPRQQPARNRRSTEGAVVAEPKKHVALVSENSLRSCTDTVVGNRRNSTTALSTPTVGLEHYASKKDLQLLVEKNSTPRDSLLSMTRKWFHKFMC